MRLNDDLGDDGDMDDKSHEDDFDVHQEWRDWFEICIFLSWWVSHLRGWQ